MLCVLPIWHRIRATPTDPRSPRGQCRSELQSFRPWCHAKYPHFQRKWRKAILEQLWISGNCIHKSFPVTSNLRLPAIFWMWNNLFYGTLDLTKQKKNIQHFYHLDRPVTTCNLFFQGTRCKTWETYTAERFTKPCAGGGWDLHTWNSSGFHSCIVEMQKKQNVSWDKTDITDITIYSKYPHLRWVFTSFFVFCSPPFLSWNTTHHMPRPWSSFLFSFTPSQSSQCSPQLLGRLWLGAAISGPAKRFGWFSTYQPPRFRWEKISRMPLGLVSKCPSGMQGQIHRTGKQPWASSKHHRCLSRS